MIRLKDRFNSIARGVNRDPFKDLGPAGEKKNWVVRCWKPQAQAVEMLTANAEALARLKRIKSCGCDAARRPLPMPAETDPGQTYHRR